MSPVVTLYLIHAPVPRAHANHYLGITKHASLVPRMKEHLSGRGNALVQLYAEALGLTSPEQVIERLVAATWPGTRTEERRLKNRKCLGRICPVCRAAKGLGPYVPNHQRKGGEHGAVENSIQG